MTSYPLSPRRMEKALRMVSLSSTTRISGCERSASFTRGASFWPFTSREREVEPAPLADLALQPDLPTMQVNEVPCDGQPEARAVVETCSRAIHLSELPEDHLVMIRLYANSVVDHRKFQPTRFLRRALGLYLNPSAIRSELDRVPDEVAENMDHFVTI